VQLLRTSFLPFLIACAGHAPSASSTSGNAPGFKWSLVGAVSHPTSRKTLGHQPPFTPYAAERFQEGGRDRRSFNAMFCRSVPARGIQAGIMAVSKIVQTPARDGYPFRESAPRFASFHTDGRSHPKDVDPHMVLGILSASGKETPLFVDTIGLNDPDVARHGPGHEHSDQLHLSSKNSKRIDNNNIKWTVTFRRSNVLYTEPWSITLPIARQNTEKSCRTPARRTRKIELHLRRTKEIKKS